jgi:ribosomal protein S18 acetylase RimI-like enzyme
MNKPHSNINFCFCDYNNPLHCRKVAELINHYIADPMGGGDGLNIEQGQKLIKGLSAHPSSFVLFVLYNGEYAGLATCFINFSTFKVKQYINLHDVVVLKKFRGKGLGRKLLEKIIAIAEERNYCKVTLEVRDDNTNAKELYTDLGFRDTEPLMHFWTKVL